MMISVLNTQVLTAHTDEVLHVAFCPSGDRFVTSSMDGAFIVWSVRSEGARLEHREDMRRYNWRYTWATRYNQAASLLLVSGVMDEVFAEVFAVFEVTEAGEYRLR